MKKLILQSERTRMETYFASTESNFILNINWLNWYLSLRTNTILRRQICLSLQPQCSFQQFECRQIFWWVFPLICLKMTLESSYCLMSPWRSSICTWLCASRNRQSASTLRISLQMDGHLNSYFPLASIWTYQCPCSQWIALCQHQTSYGTLAALTPTHWISFFV